jgi:hypothetical protein
MGMVRVGHDTAHGRVGRGGAPASAGVAGGGWGAFRRARYSPSTPLVLFHAVNAAGPRQSVALLKAAGVAELSRVALFKRLCRSGAWLAWMARGLCDTLRDRPGLAGQMRARAVDSITVQGPASRGTEWRVHSALDLGRRLAGAERCPRGGGSGAPAGAKGRWDPGRPRLLPSARASRRARGRVAGAPAAPGRQAIARTGGGRASARPAGRARPRESAPPRKTGKSIPAPSQRQPS